MQFIMSSLLLYSQEKLFLDFSLSKIHTKHLWKVLEIH